MNITRRDPITGTENTLDLPVTEEQLVKWQNGGMIQRVMPHLSADQREFIMSGLMPGGWDKLFPPEDEDFDDGSFPDDVQKRMDELSDNNLNA